jgi:alpha-galactosidase
MHRRDFAASMLGGMAAAGQVRIESNALNNAFSIDNGVVRKRVRLDAQGVLRLEYFGFSGGPNLAAENTRWGHDLYVKAGADFFFGISGRRFEFLSRVPSADELVLRFRDTTTKLEYTLHTRAFAGLAVMEQWVEILNRGSEPAIIERFDPLLLPVKLAAAESCGLMWVQGCQDYGFGRGVGTDVQPFGPFRVRHERIAPGGSVTIQNTAPHYANERRSTSSSENLNWFSLELAGGGLFGGLAYSGEWSLDFARTGQEVLIHGGVHYFSRRLAPGEALVSPRAFVAPYRGGVDDGVHELHRYLRAHVMPPPPDAAFPWVCYNTWYQWSIALEQESLKKEAALAAGLGIECFYLDAGWWEGSVAQGSFGKGLGSWVENRRKFPAGIAAFADYVRGLGMKFGLWVEPERVDGSLLDQGADPLREIWLARRDGQPRSRPDGTHQLCLGCPEAVAWIERKLAFLIREYRVDWLKWDHNFYLPCNRADHGHQAGDGGFAHIQGLYGVLGRLRASSPKLVIENCAGGGNRIDFGMARHTHTNWVSDDTIPSFRVRYHSLGCSYPLPAQYQNSWYIASRRGAEAVTAETPARLLDYLFRSRMIGAFGISDRLAEWPPNVREAARRAIADYKRMRPILTGGDVHHILPQPLLFVPPLAPPEQWEAIEYFHPALQRGVILVFRARAPQSRAALPVRGLDPARRYTIRSETRTGREWMRSPITVELPEQDSSEILWIEG